MINDFENSLDSLLASFGIEKMADVAPDLPPTSNIVDGMATDSKRTGKQGLPSSPSIKASSLPNGVRNEGNGNPVTTIAGRMGGMEVASAYKAIKSFVQSKAAVKLGFRKAAHRLMAFGPSEAINNEKLLGFSLTALKQKYASVSSGDLKTKLAADPLVKEFLQLANKSKVAFGVSTLDAISDMLTSALGAGKALGGALSPKENKLLMYGKLSHTPNGSSPLNP